MSDSTDFNLFRANDDIALIALNLKSIGWLSFNKRSLQRIIYLSKVLYSFMYTDEKDNIFNSYSFSVSAYGPHASLIDRSLAYLESNQFLEPDEVGNIKIARKLPENNISEKKKEWIKTIILILGKYGEDRIFGFVVNDPLYSEAVQSNQQTALIDASPENKTVQVLTDFRSAFEETLKDTSSISKGEYLDLYFEYIFGQIITQ